MYTKLINEIQKIENKTNNIKKIIINNQFLAVIQNGLSMVKQFIGIKQDIWKVHAINATDFKCHVVVIIVSIQLLSQ